MLQSDNWELPTFWTNRLSQNISN